MNKLIRKASAPAALLVGLGVGAAAMHTVREPESPLVTQALAQNPVSEPATTSAAPDPSGLAAAFRNASSAALPAVVRIVVDEAPRQVRDQLPDMFQGTPFEQFFGSPHLQMRPQKASGSGFIISSDGYILTNNHVVENATDVTVTLTDKRQFNAKVVGRDPNTDVAVIKIDATSLPTVKLGNSEALRVGDWVLALGYPLSLGETVTAGIVSAKGKSIGIMRRNDEATAPLEHFIQTDAAINPGNSGGPLVDLRGMVVGINTAIASPTGSYSGYGFSIPIQLARRVANDLIQYGAVHRPKLGVSIKDVNLADKEVYGLPSAEGVVVATVPDGPSKDAGIRIGDVIVGVNGSPVEDGGDLMQRIALLQPGQKVTLDIIRYGQKKKIDVELGQFEEQAPTRSATAETSTDAMSMLGFQVSPMTPRIARDLGIDANSDDLVITRVDPTGSAPQGLLGLRIDKLNGHQIESEDDLRAAASDLKPGATVSVLGRLPNGQSTIINYKLRG